MSHALPPHARPAVAGWIDRSDRVRVEVTGPDRAKFLHNLTTNEVKRLATGRGCEAFVTSPQGRTIGYITLLADEDRILVRSDPDGLGLALPHLRKYGIFDDVVIDERSEATCEIHLAGAAAEDLLRRAGARTPDAADYSHVGASLGGLGVRIIRESPAGLPGLTLIGLRGDARAIVDALTSAVAEQETLEEIAPSAFEALRIEAGTPVSGKDVTEKNLPQEFGRDDRAISFVKGCYLGQETVARLDAMGHVNQVLKGLALEPGAACPEPGTALEDDGKRAGTITSAAASPWRGHPVALAMVRVGHARAGTTLTIAGSGATATMVDLPFPTRA